MNPTLIAYALLGLVAWTGVVGGTAYYKGKEQCQIEQKAAEKTHVETVLDTREKNDHDSNKDAKGNIQQVEVVKWKTREVVKNVPVYVNRVADSRCTVGVGFVRLHDLSASGTGREDNPDTSGQLYDTPSGVSLSTVASTIAENYGTCRAEMKRFEGLQDWVTKYCKGE